MIKRVDYIPFTFNDFVGINSDSAKTTDKELYTAYNFNLTQRGLLEVRGGSDTINSSNPVTVTSGKGIISLEELWTRDLATGVKTRHHLGIAKTNLFSIQTTGDTLAVSGLTNIETGLTLDAIPDTEKFQNKLFYVNGNESFWTDGSNYYILGAQTPTVDPTVNTASGTGGHMSDGAYRYFYAYARSTSYGFYGEVSDYVEHTLSGGGSVQKISIDCKATPSGVDTSADKIYLFRTKVGDNASWYKVAEGTNTKDGATVTIETTISDGSILDSNIYTAGNEVPVDGIKFIQKGLSRMFYADDNYIYYSKPNLPECVPSENIIKIAEDDGQNITGLGIILNYLIIFKQSKTVILDVTSVGDIDPTIISNNIGCLNHRTIVPVMNGQLTIWLSQEGFMATDGVEVKSIVTDKIYYDLKNMDFSKVSEATAVYYKAKRQYICTVPYLNGIAKIWVFSTDRGGFTEHAYAYDPSSYAIFTDENDVEKLIQGKPSTTSGYIVECDTGEGGDDGADITWSTTTPFTSLDRPDILKNLRSGLLEWIASSPINATMVIGTDGTSNIDTVPVSHSGSVGFDTAGDGFDAAGVGFDMSGQEIEEFQFANSRASTFSLGLYGSGTATVTIQSIQVSFFAIGKRGHSD